MSIVNIPPLKFNPILKSVIWGGEKIAPLKGIVTEQDHIGESWEISGVKGNESVVANGPDAGLTLTGMIEKYKGDLVGEKVYKKFGSTFPLLIKIIDAEQDLSLQVHPDDELAMKRHNSLGKTEMWYIVDTRPDAVICAGFAEEVTPEQYAEKVADNTLMDVVAHHKSHPGDVFFLPAGRIHSIGAGNLLVEVQETSDITYRIYDFGRIGADGKPRELHVEQAKDAIDYKVYPSYVSKPEEYGNGLSRLASCSHFEVFRQVVDKKAILHTEVFDSFMTLTCVDGKLTVTDSNDNTIELVAGESALIPACTKEVTLSGHGTVISASCPA